MIRFYSISLGCPKNTVDTEKTLGDLAFFFGGARAVDSPEEADLVFINTCGFIQTAVEESVQSILGVIADVATIKAADRPLLAVAGCLVGRFGGLNLRPELPEVDLLLESGDLPEWGEMIRSKLLERSGGLTSGQPAPSSTALARPGGQRLLSTGPSFAWLKVSEGCRHACSFCTIPSIRGTLRSFPAESIEEEARQILQQGVREINLVAQDLTAWGQDFPENKGLIGLLERLLPLGGLDRLRLLYLYPSGLNRELLQFLRQAGPPFVPYFDIPLQHAAAPVLTRMGRPFARNPYEVIERVRSFFPEAALRTSIIVGFPGETEQDFEALCSFVSQARFTNLGVFAYQAEEGTPAAAMPGQIPEKVKQDRRDTLMRLQAEISEDILESFTGSRLAILVDREHEEWPGLHIGRTWFQAPDIDGVTYVSGPGVGPGALVEADIVESSTYDLVALT